jgi:hypothetical protein
MRNIIFLREEKTLPIEQWFNVSLIPLSNANLGLRSLLLHWVSFFYLKGLTYFLLQSNYVACDKPVSYKLLSNKIYPDVSHMWASSFLMMQNTFWCCFQRKNAELNWFIQQQIFASLRWWSLLLLYLFIVTITFHLNGKLQACQNILTMSVKTTMCITWLKRGQYGQQHQVHVQTGNDNNLTTGSSPFFSLEAILSKPLSHNFPCTHPFLFLIIELVCQFLCCSLMRSNWCQPACCLTWKLRIVCI